jgi:predicted lipid-binding transport protein (Tim44 family)
MNLTAPLSSTLRAEEAARRRQTIGAWSGLLIGLAAGFLLGCLACAVVA